MDVNLIANSSLSGAIARFMGPLMDNDFRRRFFGASAILSGAGLKPGQTVLEIGCGNGFFTLPAAKVLAKSGMLISIDPFAEAIQEVKAKLDNSGIENVRLIQSDFLHTGLPDASFDLVILFGVIPAPTFSIETLVPVVAHLLKPGGRLAVWPAFFWLPKSLTLNGILKYEGKNQGVFIFTR
jgi:ubiquinone/menaquinone biosynthesis C-methylase UbiE